MLRGLALGVLRTIDNLDITNETLTGVCFQWLDSGSYDRKVIILNSSAS